MAGSDVLMGINIKDGTLLTHPLAASIMRQQQQLVDSYRLFAW